MSRHPLERGEVQTSWTNNNHNKNIQNVVCLSLRKRHFILNSGVLEQDPNRKLTIIYINHLCNTTYNNMSVKQQKTEALLAGIKDKNNNANVASSLFRNVDILKNIVSFIGEYQYRFVAAINKDFHIAYVQLYSNNKETYYNASTVEHAKICLESLSLHHRHIIHFLVANPNTQIWNSAIRHGSLSTLQFLQ
jgi:hypothetical protein